MLELLQKLNQRNLSIALKKHLASISFILRMSAWSKDANYDSKQATSRDRFRGCLVGAVVGDCLGAQFEGISSHPIDRAIIEKKIGVSSSCINNKADGYFEFTDDTAMARSICASLIEMQQVNASDLASRFLKEFLKGKNRGYGSGMFGIFEKWQKPVGLNDSLLPAREQFGGSGSYGNGAAMRVAPVALFCHKEEDLMKISKQTALLTHTNKHGYNGAILQAFTVFKALRCNGEIDKEKLISELLEIMSQVEAVGKTSAQNIAEEKIRKMDGHPVLKSSTRFSRQPDFSFTSQLIYVASLLTEPHSNIDNSIIVENIGNDITAQEAVVAAIWSFIHNCDKDFVETLLYAVSLGGDTDTIATMACAIAGAYFGASAIPTEWTRVCEGVNDALSFADQFFDRLNDQSLI